MWQGRLRLRVAEARIPGGPAEGWRPTRPPSHACSLACLPALSCPAPPCPAPAPLRKPTECNPDDVHDDEGPEGWYGAEVEEAEEADGEDEAPYDDHRRLHPSVGGDRDRGESAGEGRSSDEEEDAEEGFDSWEAETDRSSSGLWVSRG